MIIRFGPDETDVPQCYIQCGNIVMQHQYGTQEISYKISNPFTTRDLMDLQDATKEMVAELGQYYKRKSEGGVKRDPLLYC